MFVSKCRSYIDGEGMNTSMKLVPFSVQTFSQGKDFILQGIEKEMWELYQGEQVNILNDLMASAFC